MSWSFTNNKAIYLQIIEQLINKIVTSEYPLGTKLPTVRELAADMKVNPNTLQRAFSELEMLNIIYSKTTVGRFVTEDVAILDNLRKDLANKSIDEFFTKMQQLGFSDEQIFEILKERREKND